MSDFRKMKVTNLQTQQPMGYLGVGSKLYCQLVQEGSAEEIRFDVPNYEEELAKGGLPKLLRMARWWARKQGLPQDQITPQTLTRDMVEQAAMGLGEVHLVVKKPGRLWDIAGQELWIGRGDHDWAYWSWTSSYVAVKWNQNHTLSLANEPDVVMIVDNCVEAGGPWLRWAKGANNPKVVRLDFV
jgi:hypothetical protein